MTAHPVHFHVIRPARFGRLQLAIRLVAFLALGALGVTLGLLYFVAYLALPAWAASRLSHGDDRYVRADAPRVLKALAWIGAFSAWAGLTAEHLPEGDPAQRVDLRIDERPPRVTAGQALKRVLTGIPSALGLVLVGFVGAFVWLWAALTILVKERVGPHAFAFLEGQQRWAMRLLAYQAALVDRYPPFSFEDVPLFDPGLPPSRA